MSLENARHYVSEVKSALGGSTPRYKEFLSILKGYRTGEKPVTVVIEQVSQLFQGNRELTLGFNTFLPDDYKIELTSDDDEVEEDTTAEVEDEVKSSGSGKRKKSANKKSSDVAVSLLKRRLIHQIPKNRVTSATRILLSPLTSKMQPSDLLYGHDPLADKSFTAYPPQHDVFCQICTTYVHVCILSNLLCADCGPETYCDHALQPLGIDMGSFFAQRKCFSRIFDDITCFSFQKIEAFLVVPQSRQPVRRQEVKD